MAETFETYRAYLFSIAYRMLGSAMDAEDMVQETYLRYRAAAPAEIGSLKAYLATILTRLCLDQLQLAHRKRDTYLGPWLPEPILTNETTAALRDPEEWIEEYESLSLAFLTLLEELQPIERAVFLLREVFDYEYLEIATMLGRSEAALRQSFSRAKKHLAEHRPRYPASPAAQRQMLTRFIQATQTGDMDGLLAMLAEDVTLYADGGGRVRGAATRPISGRVAVARFSVGSLRFLPPDYQVEVASVNGQPAIIIRVTGQPYLVLSIEIERDQIQSVRVVANPAKLAHV